MRRELLALALLAGCGDSGQTFVRFPAVATGTAPDPFDAGDWTVTLDVAQVGLGPFYFCTTASADADLCPAAQAEIAAFAAVDALDPEPQPLGEVFGVSGTVRSAIYDFAITWPLTAQDPVASDAAPGGHSAHFEGHAQQGDEELDFVADVDVTPLFAGTHAVQGFDSEARLESDDARLEVRLDPSAFWARVDFDELQSIGGDPVAVTPEARAYNAVVIGMTSTAQPELHWTEGGTE